MGTFMPITCEHGGDGGLLKSGWPRCPMCRRERAREEAEAARRRHRAERAEALRRVFDEPGW